MTVDPALLARLEARLGVGRRQVDSRISERAQSMMLPRDQAAIALAAENGISVTRFASAEDLAAIRGAAALVSGSVTAAPRSMVAVKAQPKARAEQKAAARRKSGKKSRGGRKVFVVFGRNRKVKESLFRLLRAFSLEPIEWNKAIAATGKAAPYVGEILDKAFAAADAVVVLMTPDDQARLKKEFATKSDAADARLRGQARANVLFEAGMAFGRHQDSTVLVEVGDLRPFSDVAGVHVVRLTNHAESRMELATKLRNAGCSVDTEGTDWLREGDFR